LLPTCCLTPHGFSLLWVPFEPVPDSHTRHCGTGLLRVWVWDIIKFSMGHPCPSLIPVQLESGGVHWTVCLCLYRFYMPQSGGVRWSPLESTGLCTYVFLWILQDPVQWTPLDCILMPLYEFYKAQSSGVHWSPLDCILIAFYEFYKAQSSGVQLDYVGER